MDRPDLYTVLQVEPTARANEIRRAYFKLAKELHPDRQAGDSTRSTEHFLAVQQAYEILIDPARRQAYDGARSRGEKTPAPTTPSSSPTSSPAPRAVPRGPTAEDERDARTAYQKALNLVDRGDFEKAGAAMRAVVRAVPDTPEYVSLFGYLMAEAGDRLHTARDYCRRAVEAEPFNPDFHARLGFVYQTAGLQNTAQQCYAEALTLDPTQPLALQYHTHSNSDGGGGFLESVKRVLNRKL